MSCFDLAWQIVVLIQTVEHSPEEEQRIGDPAGVGGSTDDKAEDLQKIAEAWQGVGIPESAPKGSKWEAAKKGGAASDFRQGEGIIATTYPTSGNHFNYYSSRVRVDTFTVHSGGTLNGGQHLHVPYVKDSMEERGPTAPHQLSSPCDRSIPRRCWGQSEEFPLSAEETKWQ